MDFTEIYKHSFNLVSFSPGAHFLLAAVQDRLIVRRSDSFQITKTWLVDSSPSPTNATLSTAQRSLPSSNGWITHAAWSYDSEYIFAACARRGVVHVFQIHDQDWNARIDAGAEGLMKVEWAPDGRTLLCFSEWGLRVTVWSLVTGASTYIQFPIHPDKGFTFRSDGRYFILAERHKSKDTLGLYDTSDSFKLVRHFPLPTSSLSSFALSPTDNHLAVWEGNLEYKLHIITLAGKVLASFTPDPEPALGVRHVAWHPSGAFLAVSGWDDRIYILDSMSWSPVVTLEISSRVPAGVTLWREPSNWQESTDGRGFLSYDKIRTPYTISITKPDHTKPNPKSGATQLEWNKTGTVLLVRFENIPNAVHLFQFPSSEESFNPKLRSVLLHSQNVLHCRWNPVRPGSMIICCGNRGIYSWSDEWQNPSGEQEEVAECIGVPAKQFDTRDVHWAPDGKGLVLLDKEKFCCAFEVEEGMTI
ncbi:hypothetical protein E1B28_000983 [Marasmius oreades]|uniref:WD repeat-containing protein 8 n=1 Tax=Marasmius oreades TaxID=181124 RepID=A0A9P7V2J5_9AGAR|nr:uncharacterized protein E1B28_000983 [Marasmius oreades]KAG7099110.1 hypothetical protein E1B28_000983 [Marasmius oreades]